MFVGFHDRQLDDKGRCALPASYRREIDDDHCYVSLGDDGCVTLRRAVDFEAHAHETIEKQKRGEISQLRRRQMATNSSIASIDKQGRITIDERFRAHAGIAPGSPVIVAGNYDAIEIWKPERFLTVEAEGRDEEPARAWED